MSDNRFYYQKRWLDLRNSVLRAAKYADQLLMREGKMVPADRVHHIFPREKYPQYQYCRWNLIAICNETHSKLHQRIGGELSDLGWELLNETAQKRGIPVTRVVMVIGLPGSGKSSYVKQRLKYGLAYDLDYIAGAFRLRGPHEEWNDAARRLANMMCGAFAESAKKYSGTVYVIRTVPTIEEVSSIMPNVVVRCTKTHDISFRKDYKRLSQKTEEEMIESLNEVKEFCRYNGIEYQEV